jgi:hypothetical protein
MNTNKVPPSGLRKRMRRGTRSCYECRKRKIRCIWANDSTICEICAAKDRRCIEQQPELIRDAALDTKESLRKRVARLEAILQASGSDDGSIVPGQPSSRTEFGAQGAQDARRGSIGTPSSSSSTAGGIATPASISSPSTAVCIDKASPQNTIDPMVTLFNNAIVSFMPSLFYTAKTTCSGEDIALSWPKTPSPKLVELEIQQAQPNVSAPVKHFYQVLYRRNSSAW